MKKVLTFVVFVLLLSCSYQEENYYEVRNLENIKLKRDEEKKIDATQCMIIQESSEGFLNNVNCSLTNSNPFTDISNTFYSSGDPNYLYFGDVLSFHLQEQIYNLYGMSILTVPRPQTRQLITSGQDYVFLSQIIDTSDIYPYISPQKANSVYENCACKYVNQVNDLRVGNNNIYILEISYLYIDYAICGGLSNTYLNIYYEIYEVTY